jgi:hypothetical protein
MKRVYDMNYGKMFFMSLTVLSLLSVLVFSAAAPNISGTLYCLYNTMKGVLAVGMLLLVVIAAIVYAVGQVLGAETRARASVWATAMFTGAIIGALLYILLPYILKTLFADDAAMVACIDNPASCSNSIAC